ncbi:O-antigen ligase family protein [Flagellimonas okinawensis]|uniref:O-antigen ligase family protein n=1 Tax=Flagellimonas okinawensis TaxID=3031324 RepID=A0ABT5XLU5_9FLAO|nr:O-antigen ligase family protein [[Muricauda] okinawensis]MDF0706855.1 O-antigen ligase family protein [[Muricauda] okinawensis]
MKLKFILEQRFWLLYMVVFTLPMYMRLNNYLLGVFILLGVLTLLFNFKKIKVEDFKDGWPIFGFFILAVIGSFYGATFSNGIKLLEKYWAFLLVPLIMLAEKDEYGKRRENIFLSLVIGSAVTLIICYGNLIYEMVSRNEPISYFFRWRHLGHQFTEIADTHPTYLGVFVVISIVFMFKSKKMSHAIKVPLILFFLFGLFQLASRIALFLAILFLILLVVNKTKKQWALLAILSLGIVFGILVFKKLGSKYVKDRLFTVESALNDKRFQRWDASYEIFKENPFLGIGFSRIESIRHEKYVEYGFDIAAREDLNAHNQLLEYLSRNGAVGGFVYVCSLVFLLLLSIYKKDYLFTYLFLIFITANLTESMMVRIKGIEYFAIFASLFLCGNFKPNNISYIKKS